MKGEVSEGHCRPILMLNNKKDEQLKLFKEIIDKKISVRKAEKFSRTIMTEPPINLTDPELKLVEQKLAEGLNAVVQVEQVGEKRKVHIEFLSKEQLETFLNKLYPSFSETI